MVVSIGHRGASGYAPENTLLAFKKALALGSEIVELDVQALSDGTLVVLHDRTVARTTNGSGYLLDKTLEDLKKLDAGEGEKIPTLSEVLDVIDKKVQVNIELKGKDTAEGVAKTITAYIRQKGWTHNHFLVSSFNHLELKKFKALQPRIKIGALISAMPVDYAKFGQDLGAHFVGLDIDFINQEFVDDAHKRGLKVYVYNLINEKGDAAMMKALGVDGIFSNYPDKI